MCQGILSSKGIPEEVISVFLQSWRTGTQKQLETYINRWDQFCLKSETDPIQPSVSQMLECLEMLKNSNIGYSGLNSACSLLSLFLTIEGYEAGNHPLVCNYIKGIFNINPSLPKFTFTWDVRKVINYLGNKWTDKLKKYFRENCHFTMNSMWVTSKRNHDCNGH